MASSFIEQQIENIVGDKTVRIIKGVNELAAKQGGETAVENYQLLGQHSLIALGVAVVAIQIAAVTISLTMSRKAEERRVERIVRRVLEEERLAQEATAQA